MAPPAQPTVEEVHVTGTWGAPVTIPAPKSGWPPEGFRLFIEPPGGEAREIGLDDTLKIRIARAPREGIVITDYERFQMGPNELHFSRGKEPWADRAPFYRIRLTLTRPETLKAPREIKLPQGTLTIRPVGTGGYVNETIEWAKVTTRGQGVRLLVTNDGYPGSWFEEIDPDRQGSIDSDYDRTRAPGERLGTIYVPAVDQTFGIPFQVRTSPYPIVEPESVSSHESYGRPAVQFSLRASGRQFGPKTTAKVTWEGQTFSVPIELPYDFEADGEAWDAALCIASSGNYCDYLGIALGTLPRGYRPSDPITLTVKEGDRVIFQKDYP